MKSFLLPALISVLSISSAASAQNTFSDFNGDGFDDVAIGSPKKAINGQAAAGAVHVIYGSASGLQTTNAIKLSQDSANVPGAAEPNDNFGAAVASGDLDFDGFDDLVVGVPGEDFTDGIDDTDAGAVIIFKGSANGITGNGSTLLSQGSDGIAGVRSDDKYFGAALAVGFFTSDFNADIAIGVPGDNSIGAEDEGSVVFVYNRNTTVDSDIERGVGGTNARFGSSLAAGDFDGDGLDDIIVGSPGASENNLSAAGTYLIGRSNGTKLGFFFNLRPNFRAANDQCGTSVATGDFNNDGVDDFVFGCPGKDLPGIPDAGSFYLGVGSQSLGIAYAMSNVTIQQFAGVAPVAGARFGASLAVADFDGDLFADLAVGAPGHDVGSADRAGAVAVSFGRSQIPNVFSRQQIWHQNVSAQGSIKNGLDSTIEIEDISESLDEFGSAIVAADFNGDGFGDLLVGTPGEDASVGAANVLYGATTSGLKVQKNRIFKPGQNGVPGLAISGRFGSSQLRNSLLSLPSSGFTGAFDSIKANCQATQCAPSGILRITNPGQTEAGPSVVDFYVSKDKVFDSSDKLLASGINVPSIASGVEVVVDFQLNAKKALLTGKYVLAILDANQQVEEADETNNTVHSVKFIGPVLNSN